VLAGLGLRMLWAGFSNREAEDDKPQRHSFWLLALTGLGPSIDAMAVGVSLAFLDVNIVATAAAISASRRW
jgi:putative Mn2+ efflux pump MntP